MSIEAEPGTGEQRAVPPVPRRLLLPRRIEDRVDPGPPRPVAVPWLLRSLAGWGWRLLVVVAAAALLIIGLLKLYVVVIPVILALFLASVLEGPTARLRRRGWPPALAAAVVFLGGLGSLVGILVWIGVGVAGEFGALGDKLTEGAEVARRWAEGPPLRLPPERVAELDADLRGAFRSGVARLGEGAASGARTAGELLSGVVLMLFTLFFLLKDGQRMGEWMRQRLPDSCRDDLVALTGSSRLIMRGYLVATGLTGLIDGVLIGLALWVLDVPLALPLGVLTFLGGFVPIIGASAAGLIAAVVALVANGPGTALLVVGATLIVQQVEGNLLQPFILERAVRLHPLVTVWAVAAGVLIGGFLGAFLAVPLTAIAVVVVSYYQRSNEEAVLYKDLTPSPNPTT
ncbi:MAG: AI-2E family transporter [Acidimicrobiales bacterium]